MAKRPLSDFHPRERLASVPHTTRRFACRSALAVSPDAQTLAVISDQGAGTYEAWTLPATGGKPQRAIALAAHAVRSLCWSANGELIAAADRGGTELHQLHVRHPDGPTLPLSTDPAGPVPRLLSWHAASPARAFVAVSSADGRTQIWSVNEDGYSTLRWRIGSGPIRERRLDGAACEDLVISADGSRAAFTRLSPTEPWQVWTLDTATGDARIALGSTVVVPKGELVEPELIRIAGPDGEIPCFVYRPRDARGPMPAVLYPHGGPEGQSRPAFGAHLTHLAALIHRGIALVVPNIHGSTGYGRKWQAAIHKDWGGIDLRDLRAVTDWMTKQKDFDRWRLAVYGGSYGGFAALLCVTQIPAGWRCAVHVFGVANLVTMIENAQPNWRRFLTRWIGDLEHDRTKPVARLPIPHIDNGRCPMLILQGENDPRVPKEESDQVDERLRALGRRVEYVVYPDEGHGFTKRDNAEDAYGRILDFLTRELGV